MSICVSAKTKKQVEKLAEDQFRGNMSAAGETLLLKGLGYFNG